LESHKLGHGGDTRVASGPPHDWWTPS
jgi:hypothetical protein